MGKGGATVAAYFRSVNLAGERRLCELPHWARKNSRGTAKRLLAISGGIGDDRGRQAKQEKAEQFDGGSHGMHTTMQIPQTKKPLQSETQTGQQPHDEQAAFVMMTKVLESVAVLSVIEALIFDLPSALCHAIQTATAHLRR